MFVDNIQTLASVALTIVGFVGSLYTVPSGHIRVQILVGKNGHEGLASAQGDIPLIHLQNSSKADIGVHDPGDVKRKTADINNAWTYDIPTTSSSELKFVELKMGYKDKLQTYLTREAGPQSLEDGICMAYLAWIPDHTMLNSDTRAGAITGDLFYLCGYSWYYSGRQMDGKHLRCGWLDYDNSNGNSVYGLFLNTDIWDGFGNNAYVTAGAGAIELCDSLTSRERSMLSLQEGIFCDMATKTKVPMRRDGQTEGCIIYGDSRSIKRDSHIHGVVRAVNASQEILSHNYFSLEYFVVSDINGVIIDDGSA
ncbi:hypothetical protein BGZ68_009578 [Mortierella alpina]|nr:hypothetical protein BGZ68_009578 [Mortierella alpina]